MKELTDTNWRKEYMEYTSSKYELELLDRGPRSLSQSWVLGALYQKYKRVKGIPPDPEPPDCSSSFKEWNSRIK